MSRIELRTADLPSVLGRGQPAGPPIVAVTGSADDPATNERAADDSAVLSGCVNNAAIFRDAALHTGPPPRSPA